jgi:hypothetical protein
VYIEVEESLTGAISQYYAIGTIAINEMIKCVARNRRARESGRKCIDVAIYLRRNGEPCNIVSYRCVRAYANNAYVFAICRTRSSATYIFTVTPSGLDFYVSGILKTNPCYGLPATGYRISGYTG